MNIEGRETKNFNNPHVSINNISESYNNNFSNLNNSINSAISGQTLSTPLGVRMDRSASIENKFLRIKKQSNSMSTSSLLRQYRQSNNSINSTNTSTGHKRSTSINNN